jgi:hypothetical protein
VNRTPRRGAAAGEAECGSGLRRLEGFLYWQAEVDGARTRAQAFADHLGWLTGAQREDVVRAYTADQLGSSRAAVRGTAVRAQELQAQYQDRYTRLRARLVLVSLTVTAAASTASALLAALVAAR